MHQEKKQQQTSVNEIQEKKKNDDFLYIQNGKRITFRIFEKGQFQCPYCEKFFTSIVKHMSNKNCKISQSNIDMEEFTSQLDSFREGYRLELGRKRNLRKRNKLMVEKGAEQIRREENERKLKSRAKLMEEKGPEHARKQNIEWRSKSKYKLDKEKGPEHAKKQINERKSKSRTKSKEEKGLEHVRKQNNEWKSKSRDKSRVEKGPEHDR